MKNYDYFNFSKTPYDLTNKEKLVEDYVLYFATKTLSMFEYDNLPEGMDADEIEKIIQTRGVGTVPIEKIDGKYYMFDGALGGAPDPYYEPTISVVANPALNLSKEYKIHDDCVVIKNDSYHIGLLPLFAKYATMLAENDISIYDADINARIIALITAGTDKSLKAAEKYLEDIKNGKLGVIADSSFMEGLKTQPYGGASAVASIKTLIELHQYRLASLWNELGLRDNYNMKREAINGAEAALNDDILLPLPDNMLKCRQKGWDEFNKKTGENVKVRLSSAWEDRKQERNLSIIQLEENTFKTGSKLETSILAETLEDEAEDIGIPQDNAEQAAAEMLSSDNTKDATEVEDETLQKN